MSTWVLLLGGICVCEMCMEMGLRLVGLGGLGDYLKLLSYCIWHNDPIGSLTTPRQIDSLDVEAHVTTEDRSWGDTIGKATEVVGPDVSHVEVVISTL